MKHTYYFIGIGGVGMSSLAHLLLDQSHTVEGSDAQLNSYAKGLRARGATIFQGHDASRITPTHTVVYSSAIPRDNPELQRACALGCPLLHRSDLLRALAAASKPLVVTGTHGKTTTTALLSYLLSEAGFNPSYVIGGQTPSLPSHGRIDRGSYFVIEGDESDGSFLKIAPYGAIITNIEADHLDYWKSFEALKAGFKAFIDSVQGPLFWCFDDPVLRSLSPPGRSYGWGRGADIPVDPSRALGLIGRHNLLNATAAAALAAALGASPEAVNRGLKTFRTAARRLEFIKSERGIDFYDDYAHHPTEIAASYQALLDAAQGRRVIVVFQPHRYSRVRDLLSEFQAILSSIGCLVLLPIYSAGESEIFGLNEALREGIAAPAFYPLTSREALSPFLAQFAQPGDIVVTMGAGDVTYLCRS